MHKFDSKSATLEHSGVNLNYYGYNVLYGTVKNATKGGFWTRARVKNGF